MSSWGSDSSGSIGLQGFTFGTGTTTVSCAWNTGLSNQYATPSGHPSIDSIPDGIQSVTFSDSYTAEHGTGYYTTYYYTVTYKDDYDSSTGLADIKISFGGETASIGFTVSSSSGGGGGATSYSAYYQLKINTDSEPITRANNSCALTTEWNCTNLTIKAAPSIKKTVFSLPSKESYSSNSDLSSYFSLNDNKTITITSEGFKNLPHDGNKHSATITITADNPSYTLPDDTSTDTYTLDSSSCKTVDSATFYFQISNNAPTGEIYTYPQHPIPNSKDTKIYIKTSDADNDLLTLLSLDRIAAGDVTPLISSENGVSITDNLYVYTDTNNWNTPRCFFRAVISDGFDEVTLMSDYIYEARVFYVNEENKEVKPITTAAYINSGDGANANDIYE